MSFIGFLKCSEGVAHWSGDDSDSCIIDMPPPYPIRPARVMALKTWKPGHPVRLTGSLTGPSVSQKSSLFIFSWKGGTLANLVSFSAFLNLLSDLFLSLEDPPFGTS